MSVKEIFDQLSIHENKNEFDKIEALGTSLLGAPNSSFDHQAFQKCVISLIQNDEYESGLKLVNKLLTNKSKESVIPKDYIAFETLYLYYKLNKNTLFEEKFQQVDLNTADSIVRRALLHLKAQQFYKLGYYNNALAIYNEIIKDDELNKLDDVDLIINETAITSQQKLFVTETGDSMNVDVDSSDSYDLQFNKALIKINERQFDNALEHLKHAESAAQDINSSEGLLDMFLEVGPMILQIAYTYQITNQNDKSLEVLNNFYEKFHAILNSSDSKSNPNVELLKLNYINNYFSLVFSNVNLDEANVILNQYDFASMVSRLEANNKLLKSQYFTLKRNEAIFNNTIHKGISIPETLNFVISASDDFKRVFNTNIIDDNENYDLTVLGLACLRESKLNILDELGAAQRDAKLPGAFYKYIKNSVAQLVEPIGSLKSKKIIAGSILAIQLLVDSATDKNLNSYLNNGVHLLESLSAIPEINHILVKKYFGVIVFLTSLYDLTYSQQKILEKFQAIYDMVYKEYSTDKVVISNKFQANFLKKINFEFFNYNSVNPNTKIKEQNNEKIVNLFQKLLDFNPKDELCEILKSQITSPSDVHEGNLMPVDDLVEGFDIKTLTTTEFNQVLTEYGSTLGVSQHFKKKNKRIRKLPQHPNKTTEPGKIDQERWIPMRDRTYYKVSKKDKKKRATQGLQGGNADSTTEESGIIGGGNTAASVISSGRNKKKNKKK